MLMAVAVLGLQLSWHGVGRAVSRRAVWVLYAAAIVAASFAASALACVVAGGHTASNAPDLSRPPALNNAGPG
jgi:hypothetical protein